MKVKIIIAFSLLFATSQGFSQETYESFVRSFPKVEGEDFIRFELDFKKENEMSREEALAFVYNGDTTKMTCVIKLYDPMTEKYLGIAREERFPYKIMLLDMGDYFLIASTGFDCHDSEQPQISYVNLAIVSKSYKLMDVVQVFRGVNEVQALRGGMNAKKGLILLVGDIKNQNSLKIGQQGLTEADAALLSVDKGTLKFKTLKNSTKVKVDFSFVKVAQTLGWSEFYSTKN